MGLVRNYRQLWYLLSQLGYPGDRDYLKCQTVLQWTNGRTSEAKEMTDAEYKEMIMDLERLTGRRALLKKKRSLVLKLMQKIGVDTTDWTRVNGFCVDSRIAGKEFRRLSVEDLESLSVKLRMIEKKGGLKDVLPKATLVSMPLRRESKSEFTEK